MSRRASAWLLGAVLLRLLSGPSPAYPPSAASASARASEDAYPRYLIEHPCQSWSLIDDGRGQPEAVCSALLGGERAQINVPTPYINQRVPEYALVDVPFVVQVGWTPGSFGYTDSLRRTVEWPDNRLEGYRVELRLAPEAAGPGIGAGRAAIGNLAVESLDPGLLLFAEDRYFAACAASTLGSLPASLGGLELCPPSAVERLLPRGLVTGPPAGMEPRYPWAAGAFRGGWFGGWSDWASVKASGRVLGHPAYRTELTTGWDLFARAQWDYHFRLVKERTEVCGWGYYGEPGWHWHWEFWPPMPPVCIHRTAARWEKFCPPGNPEPGCPGITYGAGADWWRAISGFEAHTIYLPEEGFRRYLDLIVFQSQALRTGP